VHRFLDHRDLHFLDFVQSATALRAPLERAAEQGVGKTVLAAIEATRRVVTTNTNLGIILLLAPLAAVPATIDLASGVERVLEQTTIEDARTVYQAIRLARPGGLGRVVEQDVQEEPTITLRAAMVLAADRDLVARQYANGYREVLHEAVPALGQSLRNEHPLETAIIGTFLRLLARHPDSLISRKAGREAALLVTQRAGEVLTAGWPENPRAVERLAEFDRWLRSPAVSLNPGTTADLVSAALFAALRDGTIQLPRPAGASSWSGT
jgi:triphosphoribosyl-dephospho-CoA synthase